MAGDADQPGCCPGRALCAGRYDRGVHHGMRRVLGDDDVCARGVTLAARLHRAASSVYAAACTRADSSCSPETPRSVPQELRNALADALLGVGRAVTGYESSCAVCVEHNIGWK